MKEKIIKWFKTHKPISWKDSLIILLLIHLFRDKFFFLWLFLWGFVTYPNKINYTPIFEKAGTKIGDAYTKAMTKIFESGLNLGDSLYPHNLWMGNLIFYVIAIISVFLLIMIIFWIINQCMYDKKIK